MEETKKEIALALSGGGYRSTLFCLGSIWRLNEFGLLPKINRITSVSGGSILSGYLAMKWNELRKSLDSNTQVFGDFKTLIAEPIMRFCSETLDIPAVIGGLLTIGKTMGDKVADKYWEKLFGSKTLQDIPTPGEGPEFIFYAASLQTGDGVRICKRYIADYKVGMIRNPKLSLARAVGASSAFPPIFSPTVIKCNPDDWQKVEGAFLYENPKYRRKLVLTDGGVYDNMGLEAVWNDGFKTVFVCDAGAPWKNIPNPRINWISQLLRINSTMGSQGLRLRKRILIENLKELDSEGKPIKYGGTYWGIATHINDYQLQDAMVTDNKVTGSLQDVRTRLNRFTPQEQGRLINWGYALTDTALRRWYFKEKREPGRWPIQEYVLDKRP